MHIKQNPADFRVEERTEVQPAPGGDHAFYRLEKRGWTTPDALAAVRRRWRIDVRRLGLNRWSGQWSALTWRREQRPSVSTTSMTPSSMAPTAISTSAGMQPVNAWSTLSPQPERSLRRCLYP